MKKTTILLLMLFGFIAVSRAQDTTPPSSPATVRDGVSAGTDISSTTSLTQLSANWTAAVDPESGITGYKYGIGTTPGGLTVVNWTTLGNVLTLSKSGLTLTIGTTYYFTVKAVNGQGLEGNATNSDGQVVISTAGADTTPPGAPSAVRDGTSAVINSSFTTSTTQLSANWDAANDAESGISNYQYAIGTTLGGTNVTMGWLSNSTNTTITKTGLTLTVGTTYYFSVKAVNGRGLIGDAANSDGQYVSGDVTPPIAPGTVRDGTGMTDAGFTYSTTTLSANWDAAVDPESGISGYQYAIGTTIGGTNMISWTSLGNVLTVSKSGLVLTIGTTYYFSVRAVSAGGTGSAANSDGQVVLQAPDITPPSAPGTVQDGTDMIDAGFTYSTTTLSANWTAAVDTESGITGYKYGIGTTPGGLTVVNWTTLGNVLALSKSGLTLTIGTTYYFTVKAINGQGIEGNAANSDGQYVTGDITPPSAPGVVRDGPTAGTDNTFTYSTTTLSANWTSSADAESGISGYNYAIGSSPGATNITNWTTLGNVLTVTKTGLNLTIGTTYYFSVKATNGAGLTGTAMNSNGQHVRLINIADTTPPGAPGVVNDGTGVDISFTYSTTTLLANWDASLDAESGISGYNYAIGSSPGATNITNWTTLGNVLTVTKTGLNLTIGTTYYFSVKAENGEGLQSSATNSNGLVVVRLPDTTPPSIPATVRDGTGTDMGSTTLTTQLSANWDASTDLESGISKYYYSIGTSPAGTDMVNWTDNGTALAVTKTGLTLSIGTTYYFAVKAENGQGIQSIAASSDGLFVITHPVNSYNIKGYLRDSNGAGIAGIIIQLSGSMTKSTGTSINGFYQFLNLPEKKDYIITPINDNYTYIPASISISSITVNLDDQNFLAVPKTVQENGSTIQNEIVEEATPQTNNTITVTETASNIIGTEVEIPAGAVSTTTIVTIGIVINPPAIPGNVQIQGNVIDFRVPESSITFNLPVTIKLPYSIEINNPYAIQAYTYNTASNAWEEIPIKSVDTSNRLIVIETTHFSYYALVFIAGDNLDRTKVYPNPCSFDDGQTQVNFAKLTAEATIKIYTISGKFIRTIEVSNGQASWDGKNEDNEKVAPGIYIYTITDSNGNKRTGKIAVVK